MNKETGLNEDQEIVIKLVEQHNSSSLNDFIKKNKGFNISFTDLEGNNLLHYCVKRTSPHMLETLQILLNNGVDARAVNSNFHTPIDVANNNENVSAVSLLKFTISMRNSKNERIIMGVENSDDN